MRVLDRIRELITPKAGDITSPEERQRIEERNRQVRARLRMLRIETEVMTARKVDELKREGL
jgi:siroheme synthase (precorrin-2 oxidase/ferrochelatase)